MPARRRIDEGKKTITIEFANGQMFGPIELNPTTDVLTQIIATLDSRLFTVEANARVTH